MYPFQIRRILLLSLPLCYFLHFACSSEDILGPCSAVTANIGDSNSASSQPFVCYNSSHYHSKFRPGGGESSANKSRLEIETFVQIVDVREINENSFFFTLAIQMDTSWIDPRLTVYQGGKTGSSNLTVTSHVESLIWKPNIYIYDLRLFRTVGSINSDKIHSMTITPEGLVTLTDRYEVDVTCGYNHTVFPFDQQNCPFRFGVLDYESKDVLFRATRILDWTMEKDPLYAVQSSNLPFDKTIESLGERNFTFPKGVFSYTGLTLNLSRNTHKYWGSYFIPLSLFVMVSWLSFLINVEQVPGRMGLLITLYLILVNTYSSTMAVSPPIGGFGPMGFFMMGCQGTIFLAMMEYGYLLYRVKFCLTAIHQDVNECMAKVSLPAVKLKLIKLDWYCLFVFPALFGIFNAIFWCSVTFLK